MVFVFTLPSSFSSTTVVPPKAVTGRSTASESDAAVSRAALILIDSSSCQFLACSLFPCRTFPLLDADRSPNARQTEQRPAAADVPFRDRDRPRPPDGQGKIGDDRVRRAG